MTQTSYQVILSTDGKHTVIATSEDSASAKAALEWAQSTYDQVVKRYGLKHGQPQSSNSASEEEAIPTCKVHGVPMIRVEGKHGAFWSCHERQENGSFCSYRPNGE